MVIIIYLLLLVATFSSCEICEGDDSSLILVHTPNNDLNMQSHKFCMSCISEWSHKCLGTLECLKCRYKLNPTEEMAVKLAIAQRRWTILAGKYQLALKNDITNTLKKVIYTRKQNNIHDTLINAKNAPNQNGEFLELQLDGPGNQFNVQNNLYVPILNANNAPNQNEELVEIYLEPNNLNSIAVPRRRPLALGVCQCVFNLINELLPIMLPLSPGLSMSILNFMARANLNVSPSILMLNLLLLVLFQSGSTEESGEFLGEDLSPLSPNSILYQSTDFSVFFVLLQEYLNAMRFLRWKKLRALPQAEVIAPIPENMTRFYKGLSQMNLMVPAMMPLLPANIFFPLCLASMVQSIDQELILLLAVINGMVVWNYSLPDINIVRLIVGLMLYYVTNMLKKKFDEWWTHKINN